MNKFWYRPLAYFLATLGFFLGFTSKILAQYGVWVASFRTVGTVTSETCKEALPNIRVSLEDTSGNTVSETRTDADGRFHILMYNDDYYTKSTYTIKFTDTDGASNKGLFKPLSKKISDDSESVYVLSFDGKNPCKEDTNEAPLVPEEPNPIIPDPDMIIQNLTITSDTSMKIEEPVVPPSENPSASDPKPSDTPMMPDVIVYPNPTTGNFFINFTLATGMQVTVSLYSNTGALLLTRVLHCNAGLNTEAIQPGTVASGMYILTVTAGNFSLSRQIIIKH